MSRSTLFRMDEFLFKAAAWLGTLVVLGICLTIGVLAGNETELSSRAMLMFFGFALAPIAMGTVGLQIRRREQRALSLWKIIDREVEISSVDLLRDSDWTAARLDRAIRDLNNAGFAYVVWDRQAKLVQDGRLRRSSVVVDECRSCGGKISLKVTIGSTDGVHCPYCHDPIDAALIAQEKARIIDELEEDRSTQSEGRPGPDDDRSFSFVVFGVLLTVFWPAALWYCFKHRSHLAQLVP